MGFLSKEIELLANRKSNTSKSLIKKHYSCGIFQDYGHENHNTSIKRE